MESQLYLRGRRQHTVIKFVTWNLLALEVILVIGALTRAVAGETAVLLLAMNSVLLIASTARLRRNPSCCR